MKNYMVFAGEIYIVTIIFITFADIMVKILLY